MTITLSGVETQNKGAELILYAILQEIERKYPEATVYLPMDSVQQGLSYISTSLDIRVKPIQYIRNWCKKSHMMGVWRRLHLPKIIFEDRYYVPPTDYFIEAEGYHYSDVWNHSEMVMEVRRQLLKSHKNHASKIIFMPQAFGPLETTIIKDGIKDVNRYADAVMCRDDVSYEYLKKSQLIDMNKVQLFGDYTSLVEPIILKEYNHLRNGVCIIPNGRLFDKSSLTIDKYISFIKSIVSLVRKQGKTPFILNHEGPADTEIAKKIIDCLDVPMEFVDNLNALYVKGIISTSYLVISSRFHGVASSLNSNVPCLATGWSHKYEELFKKYDMEDSMLNIEDIEASMSKVELLMKEEENLKIRLRLKDSVKKIKEETKKMWDFIWSI